MTRQSVTYLRERTLPILALFNAAQKVLAPATRKPQQKRAPRVRVEQGRLELREAHDALR